MTSSPIKIIDWPTVTMLFDRFFETNSLRKNLSTIWIQFKRLRLKYLLKPSGSDPAVSYLRSMERPDYDELSALYESALPAGSVVYNAGDRVPSFDWSFSNVWNFSIIFLHLRNRKLGLLRRVHMALVAANLWAIGKAIDFSGARLFIVFSDMQPVDNLCVQIANHHGCTTATFQHALYPDFDGAKSFLDIQYLAIQSKIFLAWGETTRDLVRKYQPATSIRIVGNPRIEVPKTTRDARKEVPMITVVLDVPVNMDQNRRLIAIAWEYARLHSLTTNICFHPIDSPNNYDLPHSVVIDDREVLKYSRLIVGHSSTLLIEALYFGPPIFQLESEETKIELPTILSFQDAKTLHNKFSKSGDIDFIAVRNTFFSLEGGESVSEIREAIASSL